MTIKMKSQNAINKKEINDLFNKLKHSMPQENDFAHDSKSGSQKCNQEEIN
jgi:hypothetical protein